MTIFRPFHRQNPNAPDASDASDQALFGHSEQRDESEEYSDDLFNDALYLEHHPLNPRLQRLFDLMPREDSQSFSENQLRALNRAIARSSKHAIDLRWSLPWFPRRLYLVVLAGPERRSKERLRREQAHWSMATTGLYTLLGLTLALGCYTLVSRRTADEWFFQETQETFHPTALPWIEDEAHCTGKTRQWKDGLCYDSDHKPEFRR